MLEDQPQSGETSLLLDANLTHNECVSMYVDVLSKAVPAWECDLTGEALVGQVLESRARLLSARLDRTQSAYDLLATEIAYDLSLIRLCHDLGMVTTAADFANPLTERTRIERMLAESCGLDLRALSRARAQA